MNGPVFVDRCFARALISPARSVYPCAGSQNNSLTCQLGGYPPRQDIPLLRRVARQQLTKNTRRALGSSTNELTVAPASAPAHSAGTAAAGDNVTNLQGSALHGILQKRGSANHDSEPHAAHNLDASSWILGARFASIDAKLQSIDSQLQAMASLSRRLAALRQPPGERLLAAFASASTPPHAASISNTTAINMDSLETAIRSRFRGTSTSTPSLGRLTIGAERPSGGPEAAPGTLRGTWRLRTAADLDTHLGHLGAGAAVVIQVMREAEGQRLLLRSLMVTAAAALHRCAPHHSAAPAPEAGLAAAAPAPASEAATAIEGTAATTAAAGAGLDAVAAAKVVGVGQQLSRALAALKEVYDAAEPSAGSPLTAELAARGLAAVRASVAAATAAMATVTVTATPTAAGACTTAVSAMVSPHGSLGGAPIAHRSHPSGTCCGGGGGGGAGGGQSLRVVPAGSAAAAAAAAAGGPLEAAAAAPGSGSGQGPAVAAAAPGGAAGSGRSRSVAGGAKPRPVIDAVHTAACDLDGGGGDAGAHGGQGTGGAAPVRHLGLYGGTFVRPSGFPPPMAAATATSRPAAASASPGQPHGAASAAAALPASGYPAGAAAATVLAAAPGAGVPTMAAGEEGVGQSSSSGNGGDGRPPSAPVRSAADWRVALQLAELLVEEAATAAAAAVRQGESQDAPAVAPMAAAAAAASPPHQLTEHERAAVVPALLVLAGCGLREEMCLSLAGWEEEQEGEEGAGTGSALLGPTSGCWTLGGRRRLRLMALLPGAPSVAETADAAHSLLGAARAVSIALQLARRAHYLHQGHQNQNRHRCEHAPGCGAGALSNPTAPSSRNSRSSSRHHQCHPSNSCNNTTGSGCSSGAAAFSSVPDGACCTCNTTSVHDRSSIAIATTTTTAAASTNSGGSRGQGVSHALLPYQGNSALYGPLYDSGGSCSTLGVSVTVVALLSDAGLRDPWVSGVGEAARAGQLPPPGPVVPGYGGYGSGVDVLCDDWGWDWEGTESVEVEFDYFAVVPRGGAL